MKPTAKLHLGDCLNVMRGMADGSVDAIVTDPPAGIAFMGSTWDDSRTWQYPIAGHGFTDGGDRLPAPTIGNPSRNPTCKGCGKRARTWEGGPAKCECSEPRFDDRAKHREARDLFVAFLTQALAECYRIVKPGGRMLCWAIPRTSHWTGTAIEDAGWIIEDRISHMFGSGFPKAKSKLKPACEDWWLARKPSQYVAPLNIDACRVGTTRPTLNIDPANCTTTGLGGFGERKGRAGRTGDTSSFDPNVGRWPANILMSHSPTCRCVGVKRVKGSGKDGPQYQTNRGTSNCYAQDEYTREMMVRSGISHVDPDGLETVPAWQCDADCAVAILDAQTGVLKSGDVKPYRRNKAGLNVDMMAGSDTSTFERSGDSGGPSRFFNAFPPPDADDIDACRLIYAAKASRRDRNEGCEGIPETALHIGAEGHKVNPTTGRPVVDLPRANNHPTVKPVMLMRHLTKLIARPGETVLDPFMGSGSTGKACMAEGVSFVGIEQSPEYHKIAKARIAAARKQAVPA